MCEDKQRCVRATLSRPEILIWEGGKETSDNNMRFSVHTPDGEVPGWREFETEDAMFYAAWTVSVVYDLRVAHTYAQSDIARRYNAWLDAHMQGEKVP